MKIEIIDDSSFPLDTGNNRIEEIDDIIEVDTCFICNGTPSVTKTIYPEKGKRHYDKRNIKFRDQLCIRVFNEKGICIDTSFV